MCNAPLPFQWQHLHRWLHASIYWTQLVENDASARPPNITSASCDLHLRPHNPGGWPLHALALGTTCANVHCNQFVRCQHLAFSKFGNRRTDRRMNRRMDGRTGREHYASGQPRLAGHKIAYLPWTCVQGSCVFMTLSAFCLR